MIKREKNREINKTNQIKPQQNNGWLMHSQCKCWWILFALDIFLLATNAQTKRDKRVKSPIHGCIVVVVFFRSLCWHTIFVARTIVCSRDNVDVYQCVNAYWNVKAKTIDIDTLCLPQKREQRTLKVYVSINVNGFSVDMSTSIGAMINIDMPPGLYKCQTTALCYPLTIPYVFNVIFIIRKCFFPFVFHSLFAEW